MTKQLPHPETTGRFVAAFFVICIFAVAAVGLQTAEGPAQAPKEIGPAEPFRVLSFTPDKTDEVLLIQWPSGREFVFNTKHIHWIEYLPPAEAARLRLPEHVSLGIGSHTRRIDIAEHENGEQLFQAILGQAVREKYQDARKPKE